MKQKSGGIKRLMEFTGKHRGLLPFPAFYLASVPFLSWGHSSASILQRVSWWPSLLERHWTPKDWYAGASLP